MFSIWLAFLTLRHFHSCYNSDDLRNAFKLLRGLEIPFDVRFTPSRDFAAEDGHQLVTKRPGGDPDTQSAQSILSRVWTTLPAIGDYANRPRWEPQSRSWGASLKQLEVKGLTLGSLEPVLDDVFQRCMWAGDGGGGNDLPRRIWTVNWIWFDRTSTWPRYFLPSVFGSLPSALPLQNFAILLGCPILHPPCNGQHHCRPEPQVLYKETRAQCGPREK